MIRIIKNIPEDIALLSNFIKNAGKSLETFRYFNNRPYEVIASHIYTILLFDENNESVAYGHLDLEHDIVWLGICIIPSAIGKGYGNMIMNNLLSKAREIKLKEITLKVDVSNEIAISLYRKHFFEVVAEEDKYLTMRYSIKNDT